MTTRRSVTTLAVVGIVALMVGQASAATVVWEGYGSPEAVGWTLVNTPETFVYDSPVPGFMEQVVVEGDGNGMFEYPGLTRSEGWYVTWRNEVVSTEHGWAVQVRVGDDVGSTYITMQTEAISVYDGTTTTGYGSLPTGFRDYRFEMAPGGTNGQLYINGTFIDDIALDVAPVSLNFGDGTGGSGREANVYWDYVGINGVGTSEIIPEPSALVLLLGVALLALPRRRRG